MYVRYDVTAADWTALADFQLAHSHALRGTIRRTYWVAAGTVIVLAGTVALLTRSTLLAFVAFVAGVVASFGIPRSIRTQLRRQMHAMFKETFPAGAVTTLHLEPREDGLVTESPQGTGVIAWSAITVIAESPDDLSLGLGGASGIVVPKRRPIEGNVEEFATEIRQHVRS